MKILQKAFVPLSCTCEAGKEIQEILFERTDERTYPHRDLCESWKTHTEEENVKNLKSSEFACAMVAVTQSSENIFKRTRFRFLWNELNFAVRKYFGRMSVAKRLASTILKALPESDQEIILGSPELDSLCNISKRRRGNC
jgi:hypothetical protein